MVEITLINVISTLKYGWNKVENGIKSQRWTSTLYQRWASTLKYGWNKVDQRYINVEIWLK